GLLRLHRRQTARHPRRHVARRTLDPRAATPAGPVGRGRGRRHDRRDRLHRLAPDCHARLPRRSTRGSEARHPQRRPRRDGRYVWRHLPLTDVHLHAQLAAEASEAAAEQGAFWEMHDLLLDHQVALDVDDLIRYATQLGLDVEQFADDLRTRSGAGRVADDLDGADLSAVTGTPTFFINGRRHYGAYDIETLSAAVRAAGARAMLAQA